MADKLILLYLPSGNGDPCRVCYTPPAVFNPTLFESAIRSAFSKEARPYSLNTIIRVMDCVVKDLDGHWKFPEYDLTIWL